MILPFGEARPEQQSSYRSVRERVSEEFRTARRVKGWTLERLASEVVTQSRGEIPSISTAHLSRVENNHARPSDEELYWINHALGEPLGSIFKEKPEAYWYVVRAKNILTRLEEVIKGRRRIERQDGAHSAFVDKHKIYMYVPLEPDLVERNEQSQAIAQESTLPLYHLPQNRVSLMEIGPASDELMLDGLDMHSGQEALFCIQGQLDFWYVTRTGEEPNKQRLYPGDFVRLDSRYKHAFRAAGNEPARALHIYSNIDPATRRIVETLPRGARPSPRTGRD
jgi:transcriptional regulator with XRE-family HTH domain